MSQIYIATCIKYNILISKTKNMKHYSKVIKSAHGKVPTYVHY